MLRQLIAKRRREGGGDTAQGNVQDRSALLQMLVQRRREQGSTEKGISASSTPSEIAEHRGRLQARADRLSSALKKTLAELDNIKDLERTASGGSDDVPASLATACRKSGSPSEPS